MRNLRLLLCLLVLSIYNNIHPQTNDTSFVSKADYTILVKQVDSLRTVIDNKDQVIEARLNMAADTISSFDYFFGGVSVLITLLGIGLPLITYFTTIKPGREQIEMFDKIMSEKILKYDEDKYSRELNNALEEMDCETLDDAKFRKGWMYVKYLMKNPVSDATVAKLCTILEHSQIEDPTDKRELLELVINLGSNKLIDRYFKSNIQTTYDVDLYACKYFSKYNKEELGSNILIDYIFSKHQEIQQFDTFFRILGNLISVKGTSIIKKLFEIENIKKLLIAVQSSYDERFNNAKNAAISSAKANKICEELKDIDFFEE